MNTILHHEQDYAVLAAQEGIRIAAAVHANEITPAAAVEHVQIVANACRDLGLSDGEIAKCIEAFERAFLAKFKNPNNVINVVAI